MAADDHSRMRMRPEEDASPDGSRTITETRTQEQIPGTSSQVAPVLRLRLHKPLSCKTVQWTNGTVDNEHMNRKKSKCCCIYVKPREFGESSSESEDDCEHCSGHVEIKKKRKPKPDSDSDTVDSGGGPSKDPSSNGNNGDGSDDQKDSESSPS